MEQEPENHIITIAHDLTLERIIQLRVRVKLGTDYNVGILTDCCSSNSEEIQQANMVDMANIGATLMTCAEFCDGKQATDWTGRVQAELL